ncbi:MAG: DUF58 domain-containing protein [Pirellulaceae bacterium]
MRDAKQTRSSRFFDVVSSVAAGLGKAITLPWRFFFAFKRSLTSASVTLMLIILMSLNIIWGYPWTGMLAACVACLFVGWIANWLTRAKLTIDCKLPTSVPAGQPFRIVTHIQNKNRLPALDTLVMYDAFDSRQPFKKQAKRSMHANRDLVDVSEPEMFPLIRSGEFKQYNATVRFHHRGIRTLPPFWVESTFPFYLFRWQSKIDVDAQVAVTPMPLDEHNSQESRRVLLSVGDWARRLLAGDASEYAGSREYVSGMSVRRWDFTSWARLGRPIVREFGSPSVRSMNVIVDTAESESVSSGKSTSHVAVRADDPESFEYLMSMTVSILDLLSNSTSSVDLYLADESVESARHQPSRPGQAFLSKGSQHKGDRDTQLIRLAICQQVDSATADAGIEDALERIGDEPTLLLTRRHLERFEHAGGNITVICIDPTSHRPANAQASRSADPETTTLAGQGALP